MFSSVTRQTPAKNDRVLTTSLRMSILFCLKVHLGLVYLSNVISVGGLSPFVLFFPVWGWLFILQIVTERRSTLPSALGVRILMSSVMVLLLLTLATPLFFGLDGNRPRAIVLAVIAFVTVLAIARNIRSFDEMDSFFNLICWLTVALILIGIWEVATGSHLPNSRHYDPNFFYADPTIPTGTLYNENQYATVVVLGLPTLLSRLFTIGKQGSKPFWGIMVFLAMFVVSQTDSRLNLLALFIVIAVYLWSSGVRRMAGGLFLLVFGATALMASQPDLIADILDRVFGQIATLSVGNFTNVNSAEIVRFNLAIMAGEIIASYPVFGLGAGGAEAYCEAGNFNTFGVCTLHNWPLEMMASFGVPTAVLHFLGIGLTLVYILRQKNVGDPRLRHLIVAALACTLTANLTASSLLVLQQIWFALGFIIIYARLCAAVGKEKSDVA